MESTIMSKFQVLQNLIHHMESPMKHGSSYQIFLFLESRGGLSVMRIVLGLMILLLVMIITI